MSVPAPMVTAPPGGFRAWCEHQGLFRPVQHAGTGLNMLPHQRMAHRARGSLDSADHPTLSRLRSAAPWREDPRHHRRIRFLLHQSSDLLYLLAIPYGVSANPAVGIAFVNVLNPYSIDLTYRLGTAILGPPVRADHLGALRCFPDGCPEWESALEPGVHSIFFTLFLWTLWRLLVARRLWTLALVLVPLGILPPNRCRS
jgi:hypothetical protein